MSCKDKSFQRYKLGRLFDMMDFDKNGTFEMKDFLAWDKRRMDNMSALGHDVTDEHRKETAKLNKSVYNMFTIYSLMGKNKKRFVGFLTIVTRMPGFKMIAKRAFKKPFEISDFDDSGDWSLEEYFQMFCEPLGISEEDAKESFKMMDKDGNGALDIEEITEGVTHYLSDLEETKWAHLLGRIDFDPNTWEE